MGKAEIQHIEMRKNRRGDERAYIVGTRVRVRDVYAEAEIHGRTPEEIVAAFPTLTLAQVHAALAHYFENRQAILEEIRREDNFVAVMQAKLGPGPLQQKISNADSSDAVSSG